MFDTGYQKGELMITRDDIVIRKAILHILDTDHGECILSGALLNPGPEMHDFIRNHIYKIVSRTISYAILIVIFPCLLT